MLALLLLFCSCARGSYSLQESRLKRAIAYEQDTGVISKQQLINSFGEPSLTEVYYPWCDVVEVWHYFSSQCCEGLHVVMVNDVVQDVKYW
jgi:hypothetical protein